MASPLVTTSHNVKRNINSQKHSNDLRKHPCETNGIFWKNEDSKGSRPGADAYIPGVDPTNSRKSKNLKWQPYKVQPKSSITSSGHVIKDVSPSPNEYAASENSIESQSTFQRSVSQNFMNETRKVFLKDLCHEDKLRVANLIQELAKVGEQREEALLKLTQERDDYNKKVKKLTDQVQWLSDEHKQTLCKMTDCHHLLNLYQHILIEQQQKKRRHSMPPGATNATSKHNKENAKRGPKTQSTSLQLPPRQSSRTQPLGTSSCLGDNLQPVKHVRRSLSPCRQPDSLHPGFSHHSPRLRRSLSPRIHPPDNVSPGNCIHHHHHHSPHQRRSLSPSSFPPERLNTQHPKFNSSYLLPMTNEAGSRVSPQTSPCLSSDRPANKSPLSRSVPESTRPNLKPPTAIYKTSPSAPGMYEKTDTYVRDHSDVESLSEFPNRFQRSPNARFGCSNNSGNQNNNNLETAECIPKPSMLPSCCNEKISSPSVAFPKRNTTFTNKSKTRLSLGPLQDPIMSSTQRSSELRFNGSYVSQNTASNQSCVLRSPTGSIRSLPACFMSKKDSSTNPCAPLKFETAQSDADFSYVRKLSFCSAQSLPTALTHLEKAPHPGTGTSAAVNEAGSAAVSKVSFADGSEELSNPGSPIRSADDGKDIKVPDTPNTDCFRLMSNEERRQFLLQQRALLEEERNRLLSILERPDLAPTFETALSKDFPSPSPGGSTDYPLMESRPNIVQGLGGALLITNNLPLNCFDKTLKSEPIPRRNKHDSLPSPPPPPPVYNSNEVEENFPTIDDDCCSLQSNCSFSSKQSSMSLIDLIDSIELKPPEDNNKGPEHYTHQNPSQMKKISKQNIKDNYPQKHELTFENQVLQDIFFLN